MTKHPTLRARAQAVVIACGALCALGALQARQSATATEAAPASAINIPFESYTLSNGLTVILSPDRTTPTVAVNAWYHVGSKNELPGRTGFAHLFEHVMFTGSGHVPYGLHDKLTEGVGGMNNGTTSNDRTTYFETVPSNYLETMLWLESDRMGFLLETLDVAKLNAQRDIVKNERRQGVDNQPYGRVDEILAEATYPAGHPYSWDVIGSMKDLSAATEADVKGFFRLYYAPNNAFLSIVGDFDAAQAKRWVERYFGPVPRGAPIRRPAVAPVSEKTDAALVEFMKELAGIRGARPVTSDELATAKNALVQRLPSMFASVSDINGAISALWVEGLPDDYYQQYAKAVTAVTKDDVVRVARQYVDLDHLAIVIVGDRASVEKPLEATKIAPIVGLDIEGDRK